jgi:hypothetical protein
MVVLRCTRQLLMRLKYPNEDTSAQSTTRLGGGYGTLIRFGRWHVLLFISERSRLPVLLPARDADRIALAFPKMVSETLMHIGVPAAAVERECLSMSPITIVLLAAVVCSARSMSLRSWRERISSRDAT